MKRQRDSQRSRVYKAEQDYWYYTRPDCHAYMDHQLDFEAVVEFTQLLSNHPAFVECYGEGWRWQVDLMAGPGFDPDKKAIGYSVASKLGALKLPAWAHRPWVVCHELAHTVNTFPNAHHGPSFVWHYVNLVRISQGDEVADPFEKFLLADGVKLAKPCLAREAPSMETLRRWQDV